MFIFGRCLLLITALLGHGLGLIVITVGRVVLHLAKYVGVHLLFSIPILLIYFMLDLSIKLKFNIVRKLEFAPAISRFVCGQF